MVDPRAGSAVLRAVGRWIGLAGRGGAFARAHARAGRRLGRRSADRQGRGTLADQHDDNRRTRRVQSAPTIKAAPPTTKAAKNGYMGVGRQQGAVNSA
eukprot:scaffold5892_cov112-Isochrysis_galbana.AAC.20